MGESDFFNIPLRHSADDSREVQEFREALREVFGFLSTHAPHGTDSMLVNRGTSDEQMLHGWVVHDGLPYYEKWLDTTGTLWIIGYGEELTTTKVDVASLPAAIVSMYTHDIQSFRHNLPL